MKVREVLDILRSAGWKEVGRRGSHRQLKHADKRGRVTVPGSHRRLDDVAESEVEDVLSNAGEDRPGEDGARVAVGQTSSGRYLKVIYVPDPEPESVFVITAYELTGKPLLAYRRRQRRRNR